MDAKAMIKAAVGRAVRVKFIRRGVTAAYSGWAKNKHVGNLAHPFDQSLGIDASGALPAYLLQTGQEADASITGYLGTVPSVMRVALSAIPDPSSWSFVDLGCGKGRALAVASELPFRRIVGMEINPDLCKIAERNARIIATRHPGRTPIEVVEGDASRPLLPAGPVVVSQYHAFHRELFSRMVVHLSACARERDLRFLYINPVHGDLVDRTSDFVRFFASRIPVAPEDRAYCQDDDETVVIWRSTALSRAHPSRCALESRSDATIVVTKADVRAELASE